MSKQSTSTSKSSRTSRTAEDDVVVTTSDRANRIARYKEERRRQLESQFKTRAVATTSPAMSTGDGGNKTEAVKRYITRNRNVTPTPEPVVGDVANGAVSGRSGSSSAAIRSTRSSRMRVASTNNSSLAVTPSLERSRRLNSHEKSPASSETSSRASSRGLGPCLLSEKDKSSKRKSNLNISLNTEELPSISVHSSDDNKDKGITRPRRRTPQPTTVLHPSKPSTSSAPVSPRFVQEHDSSSSSSTVVPHRKSSSSTRRPSDLSIHMENARRNMSQSVTTRPYIKRSSISPSVRNLKSNMIKDKFSDDSSDNARSLRNKGTNPGLSPRNSDISPYTKRLRSYGRNDLVDKNVARKLDSSFDAEPRTKNNLKKVELDSKLVKGSERRIRDNFPIIPVQNGTSDSINMESLKSSIKKLSNINCSGISSTHAFADKKRFKESQNKNSSESSESSSTAEKITKFFRSSFDKTRKKSLNSDVDLNVKIALPDVETKNTEVESLKIEQSMFSKPESDNDKKKSSSISDFQKQLSKSKSLKSPVELSGVKSIPKSSSEHSSLKSSTKNNEVSRRIDALAQLTRDTQARFERLLYRNKSSSVASSSSKLKDSPKRDVVHSKDSPKSNIKSETSAISCAGSSQCTDSNFVDRDINKSGDISMQKQENNRYVVSSNDFSVNSDDAGLKCPTRDISFNSDIFKETVENKDVGFNIEKDIVETHFTCDDPNVNNIAGSESTEQNCHIEQRRTVQESSSVKKTFTNHDTNRDSNFKNNQDDDSNSSHSNEIHLRCKDSLERELKHKSSSIDSNKSLEHDNKKNEASTSRKDSANVQTDNWKLPGPSRRNPIKYSSQSARSSPKREPLKRPKSGSISIEDTIASCNRAVRKQNEILVAAKSKQSEHIHYDSDEPYSISESQPVLRKTSILKKKSSEESHSASTSSGPVSILKRKSSQDDVALSSPSTSNTTPGQPVTFSPSVVDPPSHSARRQGILKKRCSLDESEVLRRRSCSPDVYFSEGKPSILKRRSSLEEVLILNTEPHGILKRKQARVDDDEERSLGSPEPQGILKRRSGTSSSSSSTSQHVSIAAAVILAAARGAEIVYDGTMENVKPILKKKSFSDDHSADGGSTSETPRPILKKKSSTDTDDQDDRPKKTILKKSQTEIILPSVSISSAEDSPRRHVTLRNRDDHVRPILKQRDGSPRPSRLSFEHGNDSDDSDENRPSFRRPHSASDLEDRKSKRHSIHELRVTGSDQSVDRKRSRSIGGGVPIIIKGVSVAERVLSMETFLNGNNTGAVPKQPIERRRRNLRESRFMTQPITVDEFAASTSSKPTSAVQFYSTVESTSTSEEPSPTVPLTDIFTNGTTNLPQDHSGTPHLSSKQTSSDFDTTPSINTSTSHSLDLTISSDGNNEPLRINESSDSGVLTATTSMATSIVQDIDDSDQESVEIVCRRNSVSARASLFTQLEEKMKEEAVKPPKVKKEGNQGIQKYRNKSERVNDTRFSTQPITLDEVQEAVRQNQMREENQQYNPSVSTPDLTTERRDSNTELDESDPAKLSLSERIKLFNQRVKEDKIPVGAPPAPTRRKPRFKTQPITTEEVELARNKSVMASEDNESDSNMGKDKAYENAASRMLTNEVRGILKSKSAVAPALAQLSTTTDIEGHKFLKSVLKKETEQLPNTPSEDYPSHSNLKSILKAESVTYTQRDSSSSEDSNDRFKSSMYSSKKTRPVSDLVSILHDVEEKARQKKLEAAKNIKNLLDEKENDDGNKSDKIKRDTIKNGESRDAERSAGRSTDKVTRLAKSLSAVLSAEVLGNCMGGGKPLTKSDIMRKKNASESVEHSDGNNGVSVLWKQQDEAALSSSEGESSGGREVRRIIKNEAVNRRRQAALSKQRNQPIGTPPHHLLSKSKSSSYVASKQPPSSSEQPDENNYLHPDPPPLVSAGSGVATGAMRCGVRRSRTLGCAADVGSATASGPMGAGVASIAERRAALQRSGNDDWRQRVPKLNAADEELKNIVAATKKDYKRHSSPSDLNRNLKNDEHLHSSGILADRVGKLETASHEWKKRVNQPDAVKFSVAGRMVERLSVSPPLSPYLETIVDEKNENDAGGRRKKPKPKRFRSKLAATNINRSSTPSSPEKECLNGVKRSISTPIVGHNNSSGSSGPSSPSFTGPRVTVPQINDETFTSFYSSNLTTSHTEKISTFELTSDDFDAVTSNATNLLVQKRDVRVQRRHQASRNPVKALSARTDLVNEYIEVKTGVAEKEQRRLKVEQLSKTSNLAIEALAGLASTEDFTAITLKKSQAPVGSMRPYQDLMLLHIKGRRRVQTRLVQPIAESINSGDNYVLVTPTEVYNYIGFYSNVIEQSRGAEIALHILQHKDMGCTTSKVITIHEDKNTCTKAQLESFWRLLGVDDVSSINVTGPGHTDEDEIYEQKMTDTNIVYELDGMELVPLEEFWGRVPKIEMLDPSKVLVFDFGTEMYVWSGKSAPLNARRTAARLATELWKEGYDYSDCDICPVDATSFIGNGRGNIKPMSKGERPEWALLAKITQNMETILFREKFLDWPDYSKVIRVKGGDDTDSKNVSPVIELSPCNVDTMVSSTAYKSSPQLILDGTDVGRGLGIDRNIVTTHDVTAWCILRERELSPPITDSSLGQFVATDSYIVRWKYTVTATGRELGTDRPSKHSIVGRDRCAYFYWQGKDASLNEKGAAALLSVAIDRDGKGDHGEGPRVRVAQGQEPPAFVRLFDGMMCVHASHRDEQDKSKYRMYMCRGNFPEETVLVELVPCSERQLRSRTSILIIDTAGCVITVWHGSKSMPHTKVIANKAAENIKETRAKEFDFESNSNITIREVKEGLEPKDLLETIGDRGRQLYASLLDDSRLYNKTPRLFHFSSVIGDLKATEVLCPYRSEKITPYPFLQSDLYSANQPALFLFDNSPHSLWIWQGWWPEHDDGSETLVDASEQRGSVAIRWQAVRRAAMETAIDYWKKMNPGSGSSDDEDSTSSSGSDSSVDEDSEGSVGGEILPIFLVWAGLEPLEFTNLFPTWIDRDDVAQLNMMDGRKSGESLSCQAELDRLTKRTYGPATLLQRPLPEGVDPTRLEDYLSPHHFDRLFGTTRDDFMRLPVWKRDEIKKRIGLF